MRRSTTAKAETSSLADMESAYFGNGGYSNRYYVRVRCPDLQVLDLYYDIAQNVWILESAHD